MERFTSQNGEELLNYSAALPGVMYRLILLNEKGITGWTKKGDQ
jgi:hypothetical protein